MKEAEGETGKAPGEKEILSVEELAALLGVSRYSVYKLVGEKKIPGFRVGNKFRFSRTAVLQALEKNASL